METQVLFQTNFIITQLAMFYLFYVSTTIGGLLQELLARVRYVCMRHVCVVKEGEVGFGRSLFKTVRAGHL